MSHKTYRSINLSKDLPVNKIFLFCIETQRLFQMIKKEIKNIPFGELPD